MNFEKWLRLLQQHTLREWEEHYIGYKLLKKYIKLIASTAAADKKSTPQEDENCLKRFEAGFIHLLNPEIDKINKFMEMKSKECHARLQVVKDRIDKMKNTTESSKEYDKNEVAILGKDVVNFYGELVLLENYSEWNYTGIRKIVKKYNRSMRAVLGERYIMWKCEPCFEATGSLLQLLGECQSIVQSLLFSSLFGENMKEFVMGEILEEQSVYKSSVAALEILNKMMSINHAYDNDSP